MYDPKNKGKFAAFDATRRIEKGKWSNELHTTDHIMTLRSHNDVTLIEMGTSPCYIRKLLPLERPGLMGIEPLSDFADSTQTVVMRVAGQAFPVPMAASILFRLCKAMQEANLMPGKSEPRMTPIPRPLSKGALQNFFGAAKAIAAIRKSRIEPAEQNDEAETNLDLVDGAAEGYDDQTILHSGSPHRAYLEKAPTECGPAGMLDIDEYDSDDRPLVPWPV